MYWGLRLAAWNVPKMKSMPHGLSAGNAQNTALNHDRQGVVLARLCYLIQVKTKTKKF
jgi:hypothetical protein